MKKVTFELIKSIANYYTSSIETIELCYNAIIDDSRIVTKFKPTGNGDKYPIYYADDDLLHILVYEFFIPVEHRSTVPLSFIQIFKTN